MIDWMAKKIALIAFVIMGTIALVLIPSSFWSALKYFGLVIVLLFSATFLYDLFIRSKDKIKKLEKFQLILLLFFIPLILIIFSIPLYEDYKIVRDKNIEQSNLINIEEGKAIINTVFFHSDFLLTGDITYSVNSSSFTSFELTKHPYIENLPINFYYDTYNKILFVNDLNVDLEEIKNNFTVVLKQSS